jgi:hypothetical protein
LIPFFKLTNILLGSYHTCRAVPADDIQQTTFFFLIHFQLTNNFFPFLGSSLLQQDSIRVKMAPTPTRFAPTTRASASQMEDGAMTWYLPSWVKGTKTGTNVMIRKTGAPCR